jgi:hypothetical protein
VIRKTRFTCPAPLLESSGRCQGADHNTGPLSTQKSTTVLGQQQRPAEPVPELGYFLTTMTLYLFNLTDRTFFVKSTSKRSQPAAQLSVNPNDFAELSTGKDKFELLSTKADSGATSEKVTVSSSPEVEWQYLVNPKRCSRFGWSLISMPEDCPWRIYRDQVTSLILLRLSVERLMKEYRRHLGSA